MDDLQREVLEAAGRGVFMVPQPVVDTNYVVRAEGQIRWLPTSLRRLTQEERRTAVLNGEPCACHQL